MPLLKSRLQVLARPLNLKFCIHTCRFKVLGSYYALRSRLENETDW